MLTLLSVCDYKRIDADTVRAARVDGSAKVIDNMQIVCLCWGSSRFTTRGKNGTVQH